MTHTSTEQPELLPCPFCGGKAGETHYQLGWFVACEHECSASTQATKTREQAIAAWNRRAPAVPVISEAQVLAITTAYEQGVGKGHQSHARKEAITNPYGDEWGCDSAWQMGYDEGREQAAKQGGV